MTTAIVDKGAKALLSISCGCGFVAHKLAEARTHAQEKGHILTVNGQVVPKK